MRHFHKEDVQVETSTWKSCSTSSIIRKMQIKPTMRYYLKLIRIAVIKINKQTNRITGTGTPCCITLYFIALHRCCVFYKLKARLFTRKESTTCFIPTRTLLWWSAAECAVSPRYACIGKDGDKLQPLCTVGRNEEMVQLLWKTLRWFLKQLKIELPYDPAIPLPSRYRTQKNWKQYLRKTFEYPGS